MKKKFCFLLITLFALSSCGMLAYPDKWYNIMSQWEGQKEDTVYLVYGAPDKSQTLTDGRKIVTYEVKHSHNESLYFGEITFGLTEGIVTTAAFNGDQLALNRNIKPPTAAHKIK